MTFFRKNYQKNSDEELMQLLGRGDVAAFDELHHRYSKRLLTYFFRMLGGNEQRAQDLLQDLWLKLVRKPGLFHGSGRFSSWLFKVAHNACKNEYRRLAIRNRVKYKADLDLLADSDHSKLDDIIDKKMFKQKVLEALSELDENKQSTFLLRYQEQFSIKEISEILEISEGKIKSRLFYITKYLSQKLKEFHSLTLE